MWLLQVQLHFGSWEIEDKSCFLLISSKKSQKNYVKIRKKPTKTKKNMLQLNII